jgi:formate hydrogenlyase subunit 3/multisubunit Na+/H+ antiporter MnhD subunit
LSPLTPLLILCAGAAGVLFGLLPRFRFTGLIAGTASLGALAALFLLALELPAEATLSNWAPASLFPVKLELQADAFAWLFALALLVITLTSLVTGVARPGGSRVGTRFAMLLLTAACLASIFAGNLVTRILAWALMDVIYFVALVTLAEGDDLEGQAVLNLGFNSVGTLLAVAATVLISRTSDPLSLRDAVLTPQSTLLITLAAVFRLGLFPLHLGLPTDVNIRQGLGTLLRLAPALVALETIGRLAVFGFAAPVVPWLTLLACAAAVVGAVQLWSAPDPRQGLAYLVIAQSGVALLAGLWGGAASALALLATTVAWTLGAALIYLGSGHDDGQRWATALPLIGVAAILGAPLTIGFLGFGTLYGQLLSAGGWGWVVLVIVAASQVILAAGLLYAVLWPGAAPSVEPAVAAVFYAGHSLPAVLLVVAAFFAPVVAAALDAGPRALLGFEGLASLAGMAVVVLSAAGAVALWRYDAVLRDRLSGAPGAALASLGRLDWLYRWTWNGVRALGRGVDALADVLEGEGAILWTLVAGLLVWLLWKG